MGGRRSEMAAFGSEVVPLDRPDALATYDRVIGLCSRTRYGLNEAALTAIERLDVEESGPNVLAWLAERIGGGELLLVFSRDEVFRVPAPLFLDRWQDMLCPSRDDVIIVPAGGGWALFYCHEDEFEYTKV